MIPFDPVVLFQILIENLLFVGFVLLVRRNAREELRKGIKGRNALVVERVEFAQQAGVFGAFDRVVPSQIIELTVTVSPGATMSGIVLPSQIRLKNIGFFSGNVTLNL